MWAYAVVVSVVSVFVFSLKDAGVDDNLIDSARNRALAESMATYRTAVVEMARSHPAFEGQVSEASLVLPAWWRSRVGPQAIVEGRMVAVYAVTNAQGDVLHEMLRLASGSILIGIADRSTGTLHSPSIGDTGIAVPVGVPDGTPVWLATRD